MSKKVGDHHSRCIALHGWLAVLTRQCKYYYGFTVVLNPVIFLHCFVRSCWGYVNVFQSLCLLYVIRAFDRFLHRVRAKISEVAFLGHSPTVPASRRLCKRPLTVRTLSICKLLAWRPQPMASACKRQTQEWRMSAVGWIDWISVFSCFESSKKTRKKCLWSVVERWRNDPHTCSTISAIVS